VTVEYISLLAYYKFIINLYCLVLIWDQTKKVLVKNKKILV